MHMEQYSLAIVCKVGWKHFLCLPGRVHLMIIVVSCPVSIIIRPIRLIIVTSVPWVILSIIVSYPQKIRKTELQLTVGHVKQVITDVHWLIPA